MTLSKEDILNTIANMSVMEVVELIDAMEKKFGVTAAAAAAPVAVSDEPVEKEKTEFDVLFISAGEKKVSAIKAVRSLTALGLKEAKALVDSAPSLLKEALSKEEAEKVVKVLEDAGASAEIK